MSRLQQRDARTWTTANAKSADHRSFVPRMMSIAEFAIYLCVSGASQPVRPGSVRRNLAQWFGGCLTDDDVDEAIRTMLAFGWLISRGHSLVAGEQGRVLAALLASGISHMLEPHCDPEYLAITTSPPNRVKGDSNASNW